jgi:hypothetical protein
MLFPAQAQDVAIVNRTRPRGKYEGHAKKLGFVVPFGLYPTPSGDLRFLELGDSNYAGDRLLDHIDDYGFDFTLLFSSQHLFRGPLGPLCFSSSRGLRRLACSIPCSRGCPAQLCSPFRLCSLFPLSHDLLPHHCVLAQCIDRRRLDQMMAFRRLGRGSMSAAFGL